MAARLQPRRFFSYLFDPAEGLTHYAAARWLFLRALAVIYFSAFYSLLFQLRGLIGSQGILPAAEYLQSLRALGGMRLWYAPTLYWLADSDHALMALCTLGCIASLLLLVGAWPRIMLLICFVCFLSFVSAARAFSSYQSDGMLLEAGFLSLFLAPAGLWPGLAARQRVCRAALLLLLWEWFRIYFESGVVKLLSGDPTWRNLTAMYEYYQNGPLPTWVGWYLQHAPSWFHRATAGLTLLMELVLVWLALLPGRWRIACFFIVTLWQIGVIASANYAFLNYLVLALAILLLDDSYLRHFAPRRWRAELAATAAPPAHDAVSAQRAAKWCPRIRTSVYAVLLTWIFYATAVPLIRMSWRTAPLPSAPVMALEPFRIANEYGLFAVMTPHRYEIEFEGSADGRTWKPYLFRYKPQSLNERPRIYAPYQPRFDWNLWFASLGAWQEYSIVPRTEERLLENDRDVLGLFSGSPFPAAPPRYVRAVLWQYWFSSAEQKRSQGVWWRRQLLGTYAPTITRLADGRFAIVEDASLNGPPQP